jgi:hypothetical protein
MAANANDTRTTLADLRAPQPRETQLPAVRAGFNDLAGFELMQRGAKAFAASSLVPQAYQNNVPNCIIALELAQRIGASPLMVAQNLYVVHGRPSWSAQFLIAAVNQCGRFTALQYEWSGKANTDEWTCRAWAKDKATGDRVQGPAVSIAMAKKEGWYAKNGSKWQSIPELMLMYRAATFFARTNAPELTMGLSTDDEAREIIDVHPTGDGRFEASLDTLKPAASVMDSPTGEAAAPAATAVEQNPSEASTTAASEPVPENRGMVVDLATVIGYINGAPSVEVADQALDMARSALSKKDYGKAVEAYNAKWSETVG